MLSRTLFLAHVTYKRYPGLASIAWYSLNALLQLKWVQLLCKLIRSNAHVLIKRQGDRLRRFFKCPSPLKTPRIPPGFVGIAGDMHLHAQMCSNWQQTRQRYRGKHCSRLHHLRKIVIDFVSLPLAVCVEISLLVTVTELCCWSRSEPIRHRSEKTRNYHPTNKLQRERQ